MKKVTCFMFMIFSFVLSTNSVSAACTKEEISSLKKEAENIKVTYKHLGAVENELGENEYNHFNITFKNLPSDVYIENNIGIRWEINEKKVINFDWLSGNTVFYVFSSKCNEKIKELTVTLPYFNEYSLDPLCEGIDEKEFSLCAKYRKSAYIVDYDSFLRKITEYRKKLALKEKKTAEEKKNNFLEKIYKFILKYKVYLLAFAATTLLAVILIMVVLRSRRRSVLE